MSKISDYLGDTVAELIIVVIGRLFCISVLAGAYAIGRWAAPHLGWDGSADTFGLLSALTFLWMYEHRNVEGKYERLCELLGRDTSS